MNYEVEPSLHPAGKRIIGRIAFRLDTYKARQSPAREQHRPRVWYAECLLTAFSAHPDHQRPTGDAAAHIAVDQKRQAAHHLLFDHVAPAGQQLPHPLGSRRIVAQRPLPLFVIRHARHDQDAPFAVQVNPGQTVPAHPDWANPSSACRAQPTSRSIGRHRDARTCRDASAARRQASRNWTFCALRTMHLHAPLVETMKMSVSPGDRPAGRALAASPVLLRPPVPDVS